MRARTQEGPKRRGGGGCGVGRGGGTVWPFLSALFKERIIRGTGEREAGVLK